METAFKHIATRIANAEDRFLAYAMETAGLDRAGAERALRAMRKLKVVKIDAVGGQFTFTHGAFAAADALRRAAAL